MESDAGSGNLRGSLVVSMSNARTTGSCVWKHWNGDTSRLAHHVQMTACFGRTMC